MCDNRDILYEIAKEIANDKYDCNIHDIQIIKHRIFRGPSYNRYRITIYIKLERPGLLIGKQGKRINELTTRLNTLTKSQVDIKLTEYNPLPHIYTEKELDNYCQDLVR